jgi:hypothetical protein
MGHLNSAKVVGAYTALVLVSDMSRLGSTPELKRIHLKSSFDLVFIAILIPKKI